MKLQTFLVVGVIVELCFVHGIEAKRSFGITRSRNKNNKPSVRRNHGHDFDDSPVPPVQPKAVMPELRKAPAYNSQGKPVGPPPAYPGTSHYDNRPVYGAPPAYSPSYANPPGYSQGFNQPRLGHTPGAFGQQNHYNSYNSPGMMPMGVMPMAAMPMGGGYGGYGNRGGGFGSGMMTNLFAGLAGYQLAKAFSGGHHNRDREVIVINNQQPALAENAPPAVTGDITQPAKESETHSNSYQYSTEIPHPPVTQVGPANNEYNYYGIPQYGIPLYGYSLPSQITDYYQTAIVALPQSSSHST